MSNNPLAKHFRQPALYIKLVSDGKYWPEGSIDLPATGEIPVYPMTTRDEITLRTPDALINGTSVVEVIQSCCPSIKNAWNMPSIDVDSILIAIRIASYGPAMTVSSECPHCKTEHDYDIPLQSVLDRISAPDYSKTVKAHGELTIKLKPLDYRQVSRAGSVTFEEEKLIQLLANEDLSEEERKVQYEQHVKKMIELQNENVTGCTDSITTADGTVVRDSKFISEFYANAESSILRQVQEQIRKFADDVNIKPVDTACTDCGKEFKLNVEFDYASFFAQGF